MFMALIWSAVVFEFFGVIACNPKPFNGTTKVDKKEGRFTKAIENYHFTVPHKRTASGQFSTFHIPQFFEYHGRPKSRKKRSISDPESVHYGIHLNNNLEHLELWPNTDFISPSLVIEKRDPTLPINQRDVRGVQGKKLCHYTGTVRGIPDSKVALSTCDGLVGSITLRNQRFFIEPLEEHQPNAHGHHLHIIYKRHFQNSNPTNHCGTKGTWEDAMKKRFKQKFKEGDWGFKNESKRGTVSVQRYAEVTIVCDKKFLEHYKHLDVTNYVMTVMNMVQDYYHDASTGNLIDVNVVRIVHLEKEEEEIDLVINKDSAATLESFCKWSQKINPPVESPTHHDVAMLFTKYDLCAEEENDCGLTGLAYLAGGCTHDEQCGINEDSGLLLAVVVTHELGHLLGCEHDQDATECAVQDKDESFYVMSPYVSFFTLRWSPCSTVQMKSFFENDLGECMNDEPDATLYPYANVLPGVVYDADQQCGLVFPGTKLCKSQKHRVCEELVCKTGPKDCMGKGEPAADGTKCGENQWCFRKQCIEMGQRPQAVDGGWGEWRPFSACSRTCGGGVSMSERECDNPAPQNRGRYCVGERKKVKLCNLDPCPEGSPSFRDVQCAAFNDKPWEGEMHTWKTYYHMEKPCMLYCINEKNTFVKLGVAKDGTPCKPGTKNMCISAACKTVGCDNELDSTAVEDICGVCNGDSTQCKIIEDVYKDSGAVDYTKVVVIPSGSRMIQIEEMGQSSNTIAISDNTEKHFYLNGDHREEDDGEYKFGGADGGYFHDEPKKERVIIKGPLKEDIVFFVVFYESQNVGYKYRYAEPSTDSSYEPHYQWEISEYAECSALCGGGTKTSIYDCVEAKGGKVSANFCQGIEKPADNVLNCNMEPCKKKWKEGKWGECRACRKKGGFRMRQVECVEETPRPGGDDTLLEDNKCEGPKPARYELCETPVKCDKRMVLDVPDKFSKEIWRQMKKRHLLKRDKNTNGKPNPKKKLDEDLKEDKTKNSTTKKSKTAESENSSNVTEMKPIPLKHKKGSIPVDKTPLDKIKLIVYPIEESKAASNLSDKAFESIGDSVGEVVDTAHKKVITGLEAGRLIHELQNETANANQNRKICCHKQDEKNVKKGDKENEIKDIEKQNHHKRFSSNEDDNEVCYFC